MIATSIRQLGNTRPDLYAFRIDGKVSRDDMTEMASFMNRRFDAHPGKVDMLLVFDSYEGADAGSALSWEAIRSRVKSVRNVNRYVVVGAPTEARDMIETMDKLLPVEAETFDDEAAAWASLGAQTNVTSGHPER